MATAITYAKVDGPPNDWHGLEIIDRTTGETVDAVIEVNAAEGWLRRYPRDDAGQLMLDVHQRELVVERLTGDFEIRRPADKAA